MHFYCAIFFNLLFGNHFFYFFSFSPSFDRSGHNHKRIFIRFKDNHSLSMYPFKGKRNTLQFIMHLEYFYDLTLLLESKKKALYSWVLFRTLKSLQRSHISVSKFHKIWYRTSNEPKKKKKQMIETEYWKFQIKYKRANDNNAWMQCWILKTWAEDCLCCRKVR